MILLALTHADVETLRARLRPEDRVLADTILRQLTDPLTGGGAGPRTVLLRDEGDRLPFFMVSYDDPGEAERAWGTALAGDGKVDWP